MKRKKIEKKWHRKSAKEINVSQSLELHTEIHHLKGQMTKLREFVDSTEERLQDLEIHLNLLTRLLTTLCVEKFGMRIGVLKRLIKRIEKEAIRDSQIMHLESLYQLPPSQKKSSRSSPKSDPWEDIS